MNAGSQGPSLLFPNIYQVKLQFGGEDGGWGQQGQCPKPSFHSCAHVLQQFAMHWHSCNGLQWAWAACAPGLSRSNTAYGRHPQSVL